MDESLIDNDVILRNPNMDEDSKRIKHLERKIKQLESRIPKQFPDVKFLNYRSRKRILVRTHTHFSYFHKMSHDEFSIF